MRFGRIFDYHANTFVVNLLTRTHHACLVVTKVYSYHCFQYDESVSIFSKVEQLYERDARLECKHQYYTKSKTP